jgi:hypothetical protein
VNREWVLLHLNEAQEELSRTIQEIKDDPEYGYGDFWPAMQHLYHHLNTAWNARDTSPAIVESHTDVDFVRWTQFPADLPMMGPGQPPN